MLIFNLKDLDPDSVQKSKKFPKDFMVEIKLKNMCKCTKTTTFEEKCSPCKNDLEDEECNWNQIYQIMKVLYNFIFF